MGLIAELLQRSSHSVEIFSQGEVVERQFRFYPALSETEASNPSVVVYYASTFPVRFVRGLWSSLGTLRIFKKRHRESPFQLVIIYNLKPPQVTCANYAIRHLGLPVILEYEDDAFSSFCGGSRIAFTSGYFLSKARKLLGSVTACIGVSPYLLSQVKKDVPKLLLRGVVNDAIVNSKPPAKAPRRNWVVFAGTHSRSKGLEQLVEAWNMAGLSDWELHISGEGELSRRLHQMASNSRGIVFEGVLSQRELAQLLCSAKIGINPQDVSQIPGSVFAFKTIENLAAGLHVITTPMGALEREIECGITYIPDNKVETIAATLRQVIADRCYERTAAEAARQTYGPEAVSKSLNKLIAQVMAGRAT